MRIRIDQTQQFYGKKIHHTEEWFREETKSVELIIVFDDDTRWMINPYVDKNAKFDSCKNNLLLDYGVKYSVAQLRKLKLEKLIN